MCLGIPGVIVEISADDDIAQVEVAGVRRAINVGLVRDSDLQPGEWILIHMGFALSRIDEDEAIDALDFLQEVSDAYTGELAAQAMPGDRNARGGRAEAGQADAPQANAPTTGASRRTSSGPARSGSETNTVPTPRSASTR